MSSISQLISEKTAKSQETVNNDLDRVTVTCSRKDYQKLKSYCEKRIGKGQLMKITNEIFAVALTEAIASFEKTATTTK